MSVSQINKSIQEKKDLEFTYVNYNGEVSSRRVRDIKYCNEYNEFGYNNDHIRGYCLLRNEERTFRISRISNARISTTDRLISPSVKKNINKPVVTSRTQPNNPQISTTTSKKSEGCYIATMVYGDYDLPNVVVLRHFRDNRLSMSFPGKLFIAFYYKISPSIAEKLKCHNKVNYQLNSAFKKMLDIIVRLLQQNN